MFLLVLNIYSKYIACHYLGILYN